MQMLLTRLEKQFDRLMAEEGESDGCFAEDKPNPMSAVGNHSRMRPCSSDACRRLTSPDLSHARGASASERCHKLA
jgi:hypothetical protein